MTLIIVFSLLVGIVLSGLKGMILAMLAVPIGRALIARSSR
jgi:hypothetical protein